MTVADFAGALEQLPLLEPAQREQLAALRQQFPDLKALAQELVRRGWLTTFQANQVAAGKGAALVLDQYVLLDKLGEGGMGAVFKARQQRMNRLVALKVIKGDLLKKADALTRFQREAEIAAQLSHPNVVTVFDTNEVNGTHFLVMEYLEGTDLANLVEQEGPLPVALASEYIRQAALGLHHAHEQGLVHRDIKPANLMLTRQGILKVMDLGLARIALAARETAASQKLTGTGTLMGTADYLAPEQIRDARSVDIRADIYSLGCSLYHLLTGGPPFAGGTIENKIAGHLFLEPRAIEEARPDVPAALAAVLRKMLAKAVEQRYQTPAAVAQALAPFAQGATAPVPSSFSVPLKASAASQSGETWSAQVSPVPRTESNVPAARPKHSRTGRWLVAGFLLLAAVAVLEAFLLMGAFPGTRPQTSAVALGSTSATTAPTEARAPRETTAATVPQTKPMPPTLPETKPAPPPTRPDPPPLKKDPVPDPPPPNPLVLNLGNGVTLDLVRIKQGTFLMGSPASDKEAYDDEKPQHEVTIRKDFYLGKFAVTHKQFAQFLKDADQQSEAERDGQGGWGYNADKNELEGRKPQYTWKNTGFTQSDDHPVVNVTWNDAQAFCAWLSKKTGRKVELPTEAQWEYACRAETTTRYFTGDDPASLKGFANVADQTLKAKGIKGSESWTYFDFSDEYAFTAPVGSFKGNPWKLHDMTGNVWQWCADCARKYTSDKCTDPMGPDDNSARVLRGGSWYGYPRSCRSAYRSGDAASYRLNLIGFRVAVRLD